MTDRDAEGKFQKSINDQMNQMMLQSLAQKPGARLQRRLIDADARKRKQEAEQNGN